MEFFDGLREKARARGPAESTKSIPMHAGKVGPYPPGNDPPRRPLITFALPLAIRMSYLYTIAAWSSVLAILAFGE
jgi:hypothetical protein